MGLMVKSARGDFTSCGRLIPLASDVYDLDKEWQRRSPR
jgi:hypothetical protein